MKRLEFAVKSDSEPVVFVIPGIGISYLKAVKRLKTNLVFRRYCEQAGVFDYMDANAAIFEDHDQALQDNLKNQKLSYVVNCTMSDLYINRGILPDLIIGYSMGIYAALYAGGYYSFETGLSIVKKAHFLIQEYCSSTSKKFAMGMILGLTENEIREQLLSDVADNVAIAVYNGKRNFVIAGEKEGVDFCLSRSVELGALSARPILTKHPYHTMFLKNISMEFSKFLGNLQYTTPTTNVLSLIDASIISEEHICDTITQEVYTPLRFDKAVNLVAGDYGYQTWYETGPAKSMAKLVKYINKKVKVSHQINSEPQRCKNQRASESRRQG